MKMINDKGKSKIILNISECKRFFSFIYLWTIIVYVSFCKKQLANYINKNITSFLTFYSYNLQVTYHQVSFTASTNQLFRSRSPIIAFYLSQLCLEMRKVRWAVAVWTNNYLGAPNSCQVEVDCDKYFRSNIFQ